MFSPIFIIFWAVLIKKLSKCRYFMLKVDSLCHYDTLKLIPCVLSNGDSSKVCVLGVWKLNKSTDDRKGSRNAIFDLFSQCEQTAILTVHKFREDPGDPFFYLYGNMICVARPLWYDGSQLAKYSTKTIRASTTGHNVLAVDICSKWDRFLKSVCHYKLIRLKAVYCAYRCFESSVQWPFHDGARTTLSPRLVPSRSRTIAKWSTTASPQC